MARPPGLTSKNNSPFHFQFEISITPFQNQAIKKRRFSQRNSDVLV